LRTTSKHISASFRDSTYGVLTIKGATAAAARALPANKAEAKMAVKKDFIVKKRCLDELLKECFSEIFPSKLVCFYTYFFSV